MSTPTLREKIDALLIDANRLCDRQLGGTYEADCRRSIEALREALAEAAPSGWQQALLEICQRIEAKTEAETHRELSAYRGNLIRDIYAIAETALALPPPPAHGELPTVPERTCDCGSDRPESARYSHGHLAWCSKVQP